MNKKPTSIQLFIFICFLVACIVALFSVFFDRTLHILRFFGSVASALLGCQFLYAAYLSRKERQEKGEPIFWYKQTLVWVGGVLVITFCLYFIVAIIGYIISLS
ncbi:hypothetical protein EI42_05920 [Thermosporothrix hazakensis]|jgi:amino acid permease|uniref:Uncharacterized protein n=1 Tax=Thermosporothrix hazakensis TaxID=644383 RepID=A0A326TUN1_THEHA|nr:hypothetical protein [Thermosporothrix hazakensis]PZW20547.1 hypothetical protein EI42_05920 [Thermosporothrix hazakensis]GCE51473.1 hypothetical protein KTH_63420 [Thermosporothrix hazakensis]